MILCRGRSGTLGPVVFGHVLSSLRVRCGSAYVTSWNLSKAIDNGKAVRVTFNHFHRSEARSSRHSCSAAPQPDLASTSVCGDEHFMRHALQHARTAAENGEVPVGAVLVSQSGAILAEARNAVRSLKDPTAHAEILCIRRASELLDGNWQLLADSTLYVTLEPCAMCAGAILQSRVGTVVWGAPNVLLGADGSWISLLRPAGAAEAAAEEAVGSAAADSSGDSLRCNCGQPPYKPHPFKTNIIVRSGVLRDECGAVMKAFFSEARTRGKYGRRPAADEEDASPLQHTVVVDAQEERLAGEGTTIS